MFYKHVDNRHLVQCKQSDKHSIDQGWKKRCVTRNPDEKYKQKRRAVDKFLKTYYNSGVWRETYYLGYPVLKCPLDLWIYQEIIYEVQRDLIIEAGTFNGGSALYMAHICDMIGTGEILTIDTNYKDNRPSHFRLKYLLGSSTSNDTIKKVNNIVLDKKNILVILDSKFFATFNLKGYLKKIK